MIFDDLRRPNLNAYTDYMSVRRAKQLKYIPPEYDTTIADNCVCGSERIARISGNSVTEVTCCDPFCRVKMGYQLASVFERFGYKGIGEATCLRVVNDFAAQGGRFTISDVLIDGERVSSLIGAASEKWREALELIRASRQTLGAFICKLSFPMIGSRFEEALVGVSTTDEFYAKAKEEGLLQFFSSRGVRDGTAIDCFIRYYPDIVVLAKEFAECIAASAGELLPICLTGHMQTVIGKLTKDEYLQVCSKYLSDRKGAAMGLKLVETVAKAMFVVAGPDSAANRTRKFRQALEAERRLKESGAEEWKVLYTPDEFLSLVLGQGGQNG